MDNNSTCPRLSTPLPELSTALSTTQSIALARSTNSTFCAAPPGGFSQPNLFGGGKACGGAAGGAAGGGAAGGSAAGAAAGGSAAGGAAGGGAAGGGPALVQPAVALPAVVWGSVATAIARNLGIDRRKENAPKKCAILRLRAG